MSKMTNTCHNCGLLIPDEIVILGTKRTKKRLFCSGSCAKSMKIKEFIIELIDELDRIDKIFEDRYKIYEVSALKSTIKKHQFARQKIYAEIRRRCRKYTKELLNEAHDLRERVSNQERLS